MTPPMYRPPNPPARRGSTLLLVMAALAALVGVGLLLTASTPSALPDDPAVREAMETLWKEYGVTPRHLSLVRGSVLLAYAAVALTLGLTVRRGGPVACAVAGVLCAIAALVLGLVAVANVAAGNPAGGITALVLTIVHGMAAASLTTAAAAGATVERLTVRRPLEAYYRTPSEPGRPG